MPRQILTLTQWETRVFELFSTVRVCRMTSAQVIERTDSAIYEELNRKHGTRAVYSSYVKGYVAGLISAARARIYAEQVEFCYVIDGVIFSTHKTSSHRLTEEFYSAGRGAELANYPSGHFWKDSNKPYTGPSLLSASK